MKAISSGVDLATVVSQTTTRLEAPKPVTYALSVVDLALARIRNIRSGGIAMPLRATTCSNRWTSTGLVFASGSNLLNSGSMTYGVMKTPATTQIIAGIQNQNHQRDGDLRMVQAIKSMRWLTISHSNANTFALSPSQLPQPCTERPY